MTCDTNRPCQRCLQRGLESSCQDAPRKRKKYLADVLPNVLSRHDGLSQSPPYEMGKNDTINYQSGPFQERPPLSEFNPPMPTANTDNDINQDFGAFGVYPNSHLFPSNTNQTNQDAGADMSHSQGQLKPPINQHMHQQGLPLYNKPRRTNFLSSAADLEYSTLSSILQDNFVHVNNNTSAEGTPNSLNLSPSVLPNNAPNTNITDSRNTTSSNSLNNYGQQNKPMNYTSGSSHASSPNDSIFNSKQMSSINGINKNKYYYSSKYPKCDESINQYFLGPTGSDHELIYPDVITAIEEMKALDPAVYHERNSKLLLSFTIGIIPESNEYTKGRKPQENKETFKEPDEIYAKVNKPFSYTPGYHSLIAYLRKRFPKEMLVKMAESIAAYRPSFIACTNSLKESDLIFMEQCFQRTLLTYDNFIRVSGTPTIVWRRTGEIAYVGNEFCVLTGWKKEDLLLNTKKFIVELLDDKSVVEYFQLFLKIAFGDFLGATMTECTLLTPKKDVKIRTGCMWTLKRDVFGIPMMIIGNFLPII